MRRGRLQLEAGAGDAVGRGAGGAGVAAGAGAREVDVLARGAAAVAWVVVRGGGFGVGVGVVLGGEVGVEAVEDGPDEGDGGDDEENPCFGAEWLVGGLVKCDFVREEGFFGLRGWGRAEGGLTRSRWLGRIGCL